MVCIVIPGPTQALIIEQIGKANVKGDLLEFRVDLWEPVEIFQFLSLSQLPVLLTLRSEAHGGKFKGTLEEYQARVQSLAELNSAYLDLEYDKPVELCTKAKIILSYHNCERTPEDLPALLTTMRKTPADFYKIALLTHSTLDALRIMRDLQGSDVIALGMGSYGQITRIIQPIFNAGITYAVLDNPIAPGQLTVDELIEQYHYRTLNPSTLLFALIGNPLDKSLGPVRHNQAFVHNNVNALYLKIVVKPEEIQTCMENFSYLRFRGLSVTMPLKEKILPLLQHISPEAQAIGAVNTVVKSKNGWEGFNTDASGAIDPLEALTTICGKKIVILGNGGAAKAAAYEAIKRGATVRNLSRSLGNLAEVGNDYDILINATPSPMPIDPSLILPHKIVMDMVIQPEITPFLGAAQAKHCRLIYGSQMWENQARMQHELWLRDNA